MIIRPMLSDRVKKDKTRNIVIYLYHEASRKKDRIPTDYYSTDDDWDGNYIRKGRVNHQTINSKLKAICLEIETYWLKNETLLPVQVKQWYKGRKGEFTPVTYFEYYIKLCESGDILHKKKKTKLSGAYIKTLKQCKTDTTKYLEKHYFNFNMINEDFYNRFVSFLRFDRNKNQNSIAKIVKLFQTMIRHAFKKGVHDNREHADYVVPTVKTKKLKLTVEEVEQVISLDLKEYPELIPEQERFIIAYYFMLRFGDSVSISEKNITLKDGKYFLSTFTEKTQKEILVPIHKRAYDILKKNKFKIKAVNVTSNKRLKKLGMLARINYNVTVTEFKHGIKVETVYKKYQLMKTHVTRGSRARHLFDAGLDPDVLQRLGGWSSREQMMDYIDIDLDYAADKASQHSSFA